MEEIKSDYPEGSLCRRWEEDGINFYRIEKPNETDKDKSIVNTQENK